MNKLTRGDLLSLETYAEVRPEFRARVMAHKRNRQLPIGPNATLYFEDALTMHYQVQEMLRAERIFEAAGIQEELDAYNPLIPDGSNWKATFMMEYPDEAERREKLAQLLGIEKHLWVQVADFARVTPIADEDLERETADKTSSVHFLRIELTPEMVQAVKQGAPVSMGIDHPAYNYTAEPIPQNIRDSLAGDLG
ncbi:MAG TPA: DUF3501 family protein [Gammaproteobacteria bacterium]|nr:DUF3501 family protein [Gammaproteobacteria bacterium]